MSKTNIELSITSESYKEKDKHQFCIIFLVNEFSNNKIKKFLSSGNSSDKI